MNSKVYVLSKNDALNRMIDDEKLIVADLNVDSLPKRHSYSIYATIKQVADQGKLGDGRVFVRCTFNELDYDNDSPTCSTGLIKFIGHSFVEDFIMLLTLPINCFICNFEIDAGKHSRYLLTKNLELVLDDQRANSLIYKLEPRIELLKEYSLTLPQEYTQLINVDEAQSVNLFAVIRDYEVTGRDSIYMTLTDPSLGYSHFLPFYLAGEREALPTLIAPGDIIRLHRISVQYENHYLRCFARVGHSGISWAIFSNVVGATNCLTSGDEEPLKKTDFEVVYRLRRWSLVQQRKALLNASGHNLCHASDLTPLENFRRLTYGNLLVQVIGVFRSHRAHQSLIIRCWDGTKCKTPTIAVRVVEEGMPVLNYDPILHQSAEGMFVDVFVFDEHRETAERLQSGQVVLLLNLHLGLKTPPSYAFYLHGGGMNYKRGIYPQTDENEIAAAFLKRLETITATCKSNCSSNQTDSGALRNSQTTCSNQTIGDSPSE